MTPRPVVAVYVDESCLGNGQPGDNPGGAAGVIQCFLPGRPEPAQRDFWISERATTNNRMALRSAIEAFRVLSAKDQSLRVYVTSDSIYLVKGITTWTSAWVQRGWRRKGGVIENEELWRELLDTARPHQHFWRWERGHAAHPQNEYANYLAQRAARTLSDSGGAVPSGFDAWLREERQREDKGRRTARDPDVEPDPVRFRRGCSLQGGAPARLL